MESMFCYATDFYYTVHKVKQMRHTIVIVLLTRDFYVNTLLQLQFCILKLFWM